jgi:integrase
MSKYQDLRDVRGDGRVILYKRGGLKDPKWQVRIRVPNASGYKVVSSKTADLREAERFALNLYEDTYLHVKAGGTVQSKSFKQVFEEWKKYVTTMGHTRRGGSWNSTIGRIETYALPFFGAKKINTIGPVEFSEYWAWRKNNYNRKQPSNGTLKRERTSILPVFKYALSRGYISSMPDTEPPKAALERRPTFTPDEWTAIYTRARYWVDEGQSKATWRQRFVLQQYILILANTGLRVGEARNLKWGDLRTVASPEGNRLVAEVDGKTGIREVVFMSETELYVKRLYDLRRKEIDGKPSLDGLVFCHRDGTAIQTMKNAFIALLKYAGVPLERNGGNRTLYSLRHFYATMRLSNDTSPFLLAKQMGTSIEMLEKFYGQTVSSELAAQITRSSRAKMVTVRGKDYPFE